MVGLIKSGRIRSGDKGSTDIEKRTSERNYEIGGGSIIKEQLSRVKDISRESALVQSFMGKSRILEMIEGWPVSGIFRHRVVGYHHHHHLSLASLKLLSAWLACSIQNFRENVWASQAGWWWWWWYLTTGGRKICQTGTRWGKL